VTDFTVVCGKKAYPPRIVRSDIEAALAMPEQQSDAKVQWTVIGLTAITLFPILATLFHAAAWFWHPSAILSACGDPRPAPYDRSTGAIALGSLIATAGLSAIVICLVLRLRDNTNDLVEPPALVGPIVVVAIGAALALGAVLAN
jgi:hypothetical protein